MCSEKLDELAEYSVWLTDLTLAARGLTGDRFRKRVAAYYEETCEGVKKRIKLPLDTSMVLLNKEFLCSCVV